MVLVDTSVWIRFLSGREPYAGALDRLLADGAALAHDLVEGELLIGDTGRRTTLLADYAQLSRARAVPHAEVIEFIRHRRLHGRGLGWIDVHLLASAVVDRCRIWTADAALAEAARTLRVAYAAVG